MTQFATNAEFAARLGLTLSASDQTRADTLLQFASEMIQDETKQTIELVTNDTLIRPGGYDDRIRLPQRPVVSVSSVTLDGVSLVMGTNVYLDGDELVRLNWNAAIQDSSFGLPWAGFGFPWWDLEIVYTHGFQTIPATVKNICMEAVTRVWVNPGSVAREEVGNVRTVYDNMRFSPAGLTLTDSEKEQLDKIFRRTSGSIGLR